MDDFEFQYFLLKLSLTESDWVKIVNLPAKKHTDYKNDLRVTKFAKDLAGVLKLRDSK